jgi:adenylate kinase
MPPKEDNKCDKDGEQLVQRSDDTEEVVANRLATYHRQTEPVVGYYEQNNTVYNIDADKGVDEISSLIFEKLDALARD